MKYTAYLKQEMKNPFYRAFENWSSKFPERMCICFFVWLVVCLFGCLIVCFCRQFSDVPNATLLTYGVKGAVMGWVGGCGSATTSLIASSDKSIDRSHFKVLTRAVPLFFIIMRGEFSLRSVKKTGAEIFSDG